MSLVFFFPLIVGLEGLPFRNAVLAAVVVAVLNTAGVLIDAHRGFQATTFGAALKSTPIAIASTACLMAIISGSVYVPAAYLSGNSIAW